MKAARAVGVCVVLLAHFACAAWAREPSPRCERPKIRPIRSAEDYSFLCDPECRTDFWDPAKYIAPSADGQLYLTLGFDLRERFEYFHNNDWGRDPQASLAYLPHRFMPHADLRWGESARAHLKLTNNLVWGRDARPTDKDALDVLGAFVDVRFAPLTVRFGRQEIQYADARLVSNREGPNVRLAFDGLRLMADVGDWRVDAFTVIPVQVKPGVFDDPPESGQLFWGLYASGLVSSSSTRGIDAYYLGLWRKEATFEQGTARERRHTVGARFWNQDRALDYNVELMYQFGSFGDGGIRAWGVGSRAGYTAENLPMKPRLSMQANVASGDENPDDASRLQTFNPLFPRGVYFSQENLVGPYNFFDLHPQLGLNVQGNASVVFDWDFFWRASLNDGLYLPSGVLRVPGAGNAARRIGSQPAVLVQWRPNAHATVAATASYFLAGPFFTQAGLGKNVAFVGAWVGYSM